MSTEDLTPAMQDATPANPPTNDAEAAQLDDARTDAANAEPAADEKQAEEKKRNRTREYIKRLSGENAEMRRRLMEVESRQRQEAQRQQPGAGEPRLEDFGFDVTEYAKAYAQRERQQWEQEQQQSAQLRQFEESARTYDERAAAFAESTPDFFEAVGSINPALLHPQLQIAVLSHERGPELAYYLANNEDELFQLSSMRPELMPMAVDRLSSRLGAQRRADSQSQQQTPPAFSKQISKAPPPMPMVSGRSATETPSEKMTDDEWYRRDLERRRKR